MLDLQLLKGMSERTRGRGRLHSLGAEVCPCSHAPCTTNVKFCRSDNASLLKRRSILLLWQYISARTQQYFAASTMLLCANAETLCCSDNIPLLWSRDTLFLWQSISVRIKWVIFEYKVPLFGQNGMLLVRKTTSAPTQRVNLGGEKGLWVDAEIYCCSDKISLRRRNYILSVRQSVSARTQ